MARPRRPAPHSEKPSRAPAPTDLNLSALEDALSETSDGIIRSVFPTQREHLQRCIDAGVLEAVPGERGAWRLSSAGISVLAVRRAAKTTGFAGQRSQFFDQTAPPCGAVSPPYWVTNADDLAWHDIADLLPCPKCWCEEERARWYTALAQRAAP
jgi:hypothetical protein